MRNELANKISVPLLLIGFLLINGMRNRQPKMGGP